MARTADSEALRRFVAHERLSHELDASRAAQLRRDLALTAEQRVHEAEHELTTFGDLEPMGIEQPLLFENYDDLEAWRRAPAAVGRTRLLRHIPLNFPCSPKANRHHRMDAPAAGDSTRWAWS